MAPKQKMKGGGHNDLSVGFPSKKVQKQKRQEHYVDEGEHQNGGE
jgi:hypothetical protein